MELGWSAGPPGPSPGPPGSSARTLRLQTQTALPGVATSGRGLQLGWAGASRAAAVARLSSGGPHMPCPAGMPPESASQDRRTMHVRPGLARRCNPPRDARRRATPARSACASGAAPQAGSLSAPP
jgi:hypothetical protein